MAKKLKNLPKTLFVKRSVDEGDGEEYLVVIDKAEDACELGKIVTVGKYQLVESGEVTAMPTFVPVKRS